MLAGLGLFAAPTTTMKVTHPTTTVSANPPRTNPVGQKPQTKTQLNQLKTTVEVKHPTTPVAEFPPKEDKSGKTANAPQASKGAAAPEGSYKPSYKNAKPLGGKGNKADTQKAAKLSTGEKGLGQMNAQDEAARNASAAQEYKKAESSE